MKQLLDLKEVAEYLGVDYSTAYGYATKGLLRSVRLPSLEHDGPRRKIQVRIVDLEAFVLAAEVGAEVGSVSVEKPLKRPQNRGASRIPVSGQPEWIQRYARK